VLARSLRGGRAGRPADPAGALPAPGDRSGAGAPGRRRAAAGWGRDRCRVGRGGGLCGHARLQHVGGDQRPADDGHGHRVRPRHGRGPGNRRHAAGGRRPGQQAGSGLTGRLEERWRRRQQGDR